MRLRLLEQVSSILADSEAVLGNALTRYSDWTQKHALFLQRFFQNRVDVIGWIAARDQALAEGKSEADAKAEDNAVVRLTQGSGTAADIARAERQSPFVRLFTVYSSYFIGQLNLIASRPTWGTRATAAANSILFAGVVGSAIGMALRGGWDDEDRDGNLWDDVATWSLREAASTTTATFTPIVGPIVFRRMFGDGPGRLQLGPVVSMIDRAMGAPWLATKDEIRGRGIMDIATALTMLSGIPFTAIARPIAYQVEVEAGRAQPVNTADYVRGLLMGR
jgi:hypothetical protein